MPLLGGAMIGGAAALLWLWNGRVAGVSGIAGRVFDARGDERSWRLSFLLGLVAGGALMSALFPGAFEVSAAAPSTLLLAGLLVGVGTSIGNGCTSGHGVCGVSRLSPRSIVATASFITAAAIVVYAVRHLTGAAP
jgi:uncharacterized membrane protein YedE/YeeE